MQKSNKLFAMPSYFNYLNMKVLLQTKQNKIQSTQFYLSTLSSAFNLTI